MGADSTRALPQAAECRSCKALIFWVITVREKRMPVNAAPDPAGGFVLTLKPDGQLHAEVFDFHHDSKRNRYTSHFATCPNADAHRSQPRG